MPRCKCCNDKFVARNFLQKFCMLKDECVAAFYASVKEKQKKENDKKWNAEKKEIKITAYSKENKRNLQNEINRLARKIDEYFGFTTCIDCGRDMLRQIDAAHFHSRGANSTLSYNLHNLHSATNYCNRYSVTHKEGYVAGLEKRYGREYLIQVKELPEIYKEILLSEREVAEKLELVRKLIRDFKTYVLIDGIQARDLFNKIINIYKDC